VLLHEFAHGLGFQTFVDEKTGTWFRGKPVAYDQFLLDLETNHKWTNLTPAQRKLSARSNGKVAWDGSAVAEAARWLSSGTIDGYTAIFSPDPPRAGASLSHWDTSVTPDELMEPQLSAKLRSSSHLGLAPCLLADLGWRISRPDTCFSETPAFSELMVSTTDLNLGDEIPGQTTNSEIRVTNPSTLPLDINAVGSVDELADPFAFGSDNCSGATLPPGGECTVTVAFSPARFGTYEDSFTISSNGPAHRELSVRVTGRGTGQSSPVAGSLQSPALVSAGGGAFNAVLWLLLFLAVSSTRRIGDRHLQP